MAEADAVPGVAGSADPAWEVLRRVADGDLDAFEILVSRHQGRLLALCERFLGNPQEAEEAVQEVFLKAWRKAGSLRPRGKVYTWLYRVAVNHCLNRLRRRRLRRWVPLTPRAEGDDAGPPMLEDGGGDPARALAARERWQATREALDRLPEGQRAVVLLAKFEGLSYREIGAVLGISVGAVESRLFRAMRTLERAVDWV